MLSQGDSGFCLHMALLIGSTLAPALLALGGLIARVAALPGPTGLRFSEAFVAMSLSLIETSSRQAGNSGGFS